jgi:PAS domain S-box-containing protein
MGARMRMHAWAETALGPPALWPAVLRHAAEILLENPFPMVMLAADRLVVLAYNDAYEKLLAGREALGRPYADVWPEHQDLISREFQAPLEGTPVLLEDRAYKAPGPAGGEVWFRCGLTPVKSETGEVLAVLNTAFETTPVRERERALRASRTELAASEERLRLALDVSRLATWDWDLLSGDVAWSPEHYRIQGYEEGEVKPSYEAWAARVHPDDLPGAGAALAEARDERRDYGHLFRVVRPDGGVRWCAARGRFFYDASGRPVRMVGVMEDITEQRGWEATQRVLLSELQHRTRNQLAVIRSIVRRTAEASVDMNDFMSHFEGRLGAFARTEAAMTRNAEVSVSLEDLVREEFVAAASADLTEIGGPEVRLFGRTAEILSLAIHELVTNSVKYGALASRAGRVGVRWAVEPADGAPKLAFDWIESGVPLLDTQPQRRGFGRRLLEDALPYELGAETSIAFEPGGLRVRIECPLPQAPERE